MGTVTAFVGLGSNLGEPERNLATALAALERRGLAILAKSTVYQTEPQGIHDQPWFSNQVVSIGCPASLKPLGLLDILQDVENKMGRVRSLDPDMHFGPRVIDLDLLLFGNATMHTTRLVLPHPRLTLRAFVMVPLLEIAPDIALPPPDGRRVADILRDLDYTVTGTFIFQ